MMRIVLATLVLAAACDQVQEFHCATDDQCVLGDVPGRCEANGYCSFPDVHCTSGSRYGEHASGAIASACVEGAANEACMHASPIAEGTLEGDLRGTRASPLTCSPQSNAQVFYSFDVDDCSDIDLHAEAAGGNLALGLLRNCTDELACANASQSDAGETLHAYSVPPGSYQVAVGAVNYDESFTLSMAIAPPPANDTCETALDVTTTSIAAQSLARAADDDAVPGRELYYRITAATRSVIEVGVAPMTPMGDVTVTLLDDACNVISTKPVTGPITRFGDVVAGSYRIAVEGPADQTCGRFELTATAKEVLFNNQCAAADTLVLAPTPQGFHAQRIVDLTRASDDYVGSVGGNGPDLVYQFHLTRRSQLHISAVSLTGLFHPVLYLRGPIAPTSDCAAASEVTYNDFDPGPCTAVSQMFAVSRVAAAAATGGDIDLDVTAVDANDPTGMYQLVVDSEGGTGTLALDVTAMFPGGGTGPGSALLLDTSCAVDGGTCCDQGWSVGATSQTASCVSPGRPAVYRSFEIPAGCSFINERISVSSPHPHDMSIVTDCGPPTTICNAAPATKDANGYYVTRVGGGGLDANATTTCHVIVGAYAQSDADTDVVDFHFGNGTDNCFQSLP